MAGVTSCIWLDRGNGIHMINFAFWVGAYGVAVQAGYSIYGLVGALVIAAAILVSAAGTQKSQRQCRHPMSRFG